MAYTTNQLISNAYFAAGIEDRESTISAAQISDGLDWLNDIIGEKAVDQGMIPYETTHTFNAVEGQEKYTIPDLIQINTITFFIDDVRFSMAYQKRNQYFGSTRVENIKSLPVTWYFERQLGGGDLYLYFSPDKSYPIEIHGIFRLSEVALHQDLQLTLDRFYITYLRYALAERICTEFGMTVPSGVLKQLGKYESFINKKSRLLDLSMQKTSSLQDRDGYGIWGMANLFNGFVPSGR